MVKNTKGGKGAKKQKNSTSFESDPNKTIIYKDNSNQQFYAQVEKVLGSSRYDVYCEDGVQRLAHMRGKLRRNRVQIGDILLIALREFQTDDKKCDIIHKYTDDERLLLISKGLINSITDKDKIINNEEILFCDENKDEEQIVFEGI